MRSHLLASKEYMDYKKFNKSYYDRIYGEGLKTTPGTTGWQTNVPSNKFLEFLDYLKKQKITGRALDLGCGGGRHSFEFDLQGFETRGIDFSGIAIDLAKKRAEERGVDIQFDIGSVLAIPYDDSFFDVLNDDGCLHHLIPEDQGIYVNNVTRILKKGGILRIKAFSDNCLFYSENKENQTGKWIMLKDKDLTCFFEKSDILSLFGNDFDIMKMEENAHTYTNDKVFWHVLLKKK